MVWVFLQGGKEIENRESAMGEEEAILWGPVEAERRDRWSPDSGVF